MWTLLNLAVKIKIYVLREHRKQKKLNDKIFCENGKCKVNICSVKLLSFQYIGGSCCCGS